MWFNDYALVIILEQFITFLHWSALIWQRGIKDSTDCKKNFKKIYIKDLFSGNWRIEVKPSESDIKTGIHGWKDPSSLLRNGKYNIEVCLDTVL